MILQSVELIGAYDAEKVLDQAVRELRQETEATFDRVDRGIQQSYEDGFASILEENEITSQFDVIPDLAVIDNLRQNATSLVGKWETAGLEMMQVVILTAVRQDWSEEEFRDELANIIARFQNQVDNIIRTEVNRAGNQGRLDATRYIARRYVQIYTQEDEQVCEQQLMLAAIGPVTGCRDFWDGKRQNTVFRVTDSVGLLPLHPRCLLKGTIVHTIQGQKRIEEIKVGELVLTHRGRYREVIQLHSNPYDGQVFEVGENWLTENHPVLTPQGWVRIDDIQDPTQILTLSASHDRYLPLTDFHSDQSPPSIMEKNFLPTVVSDMRISSMPVSPINLNSDLRHRETKINIVDIKGKLRNRFESSIHENTEKPLFKWRKDRTRLSSHGIIDLDLMDPQSSSASLMSCSDLVSPLFLSHPGPLEALGFRLSSGDNTCGFQPEPDDSSGDIELFGEGIFRGSSLIQINDRVHREINVPPSHSTFPAMRHKSTPTIQKHSDTYKGTVYNLSVAEDESFIIGRGRVIVHNCRCYWSPVAIPVR